MITAAYAPKRNGHAGKLYARTHSREAAQAMAAAAAKAREEALAKKIAERPRYLKQVCGFCGDGFRSLRQRTQHTKWCTK